MKRLLIRFRKVDSNKFIFWFRVKIASILNLFARIDYAFSSNVKLYDFAPEVSKSKKIFVYIKNSVYTDSETKMFQILKDFDFKIIVVDPYGILVNNVDFVLLKKSYGRDFSVIRDVMRSIGELESESIEILILNDSMYWNIEKFSSLLTRLEEYPKNKIVVPTQSIFPRPHAQPYLIYSRVEKDCLRQFGYAFEWIRNMRTKRGIVNFGELCFAEKTELAGCNVIFMAPYNALVSRNRKKLELIYSLGVLKRLNPTQHIWFGLGAFGIHAVKKSLVIKNPVGVANAPHSPEEAFTKMLFEEN